jgi:dipeptidase E
MRLLLLSNSTNAGEAYLRYPLNHIKEFLGKKPLNVLFIPFAAVTFSFDDYELKVKERFNEIGHTLISIHNSKSIRIAVKEAEAIIIGGGNTFQLLKLLQENNLLELIKERIENDIPYIGWSAGSNVACPSICTTNDMPIIEPHGFKSIGLIPFQINPHYSDVVSKNHAGETRDQRIEEYLTANPDKKVVGLWEGTMLRYVDHTLTLLGDKPAKVFTHNATIEVHKNDNLNFLLV